MTYGGFVGLAGGGGLHYGRLIGKKKTRVGGADPKAGEVTLSLACPCRGELWVFFSLKGGVIAGKWNLGGLAGGGLSM